MNTIQACWSLEPSLLAASNYHVLSKDAQDKGEYIKTGHSFGFLPSADVEGYENA